MGTLNYFLHHFRSPGIILFPQQVHNGPSQGMSECFCLYMITICWPYHFGFIYMNFFLLAWDFEILPQIHPYLHTLSFHLSFCFLYENKYSWECLSSSLKSLAFFLHSQLLYT